MMQTFLNQTTSYTRFVPTIKINILWTQFKPANLSVPSTWPLFRQFTELCVLSIAVFCLYINKLAQPKWTMNFEIFGFFFLLLIKIILILIKISSIILVKLYPQYASRRKVSVFESVQIYLYIHVGFMKYNNSK